MGMWATTRTRLQRSCRLVRRRCFALGTHRVVSSSSLGSSPCSPSSPCSGASASSSRSRILNAAQANKYLLTESELKWALQCIPFDSPGSKSFRETLWHNESVKEDQLLLAVDCEMCQTTKGQELTRVTLVDAAQRVLLDEVVRPAHPVVDFRTGVSGITREMIDNCHHTLETIQDRFVELCPAQSILIGHSIENDLKALQIVHRRLIDTTFLFKHRKFPAMRHSLRFLASELLGKKIQTSAQGHCSVEDAITALQLVQLRLEREPELKFPMVSARKSKWRRRNRL